MRILVIGAGATGGYFGARWLAAGRDVTFLVRPARAQQLAQQGLVVRSPRGDLRLPAPPTVQAGALAGPYDLVVLSCKAYDLAPAIDAFAPAVGAASVVLPLLNGMAHLDVLDARFGRARVLGGRCMISAVLDTDGAVVHLNALHGLTYGAREPLPPGRAQALSGAIEQAGFDAQPSTDIVQDMWEKWIFLATLAAATCLMRAALGAIVAAPRGADWMAQLLDECCAIAAGQGHPVRSAWRTQTLATLCTPGATTTASMLRDIERGARIEADHIVGDLLARRSAGGAATAPLSPLELAYLHLKAYEATRG